MGFFCPHGGYARMTLECDGTHFVKHNLSINNYVDHDRSSDGVGDTQVYPALHNSYEGYKVKEVASRRLKQSAMMKILDSVASADEEHFQY